MFVDQPHLHRVYKVQVEGNSSVQQKILSNHQWMYILYEGIADQYWFSVVVFYKKPQCTKNFPVLRFPLYKDEASGIAFAY